MKLISTFHTSEAADDLCQRLELAGIAVVVQAPLRIRSNSSPTHLVFAAIDAQHGDAMQLLHNPQHMVQHRVDLDAFTAHMRDPATQQTAHQTITRSLLWILLALLLAVIVVALLMLR